MEIRRDSDQSPEACLEQKEQKLDLIYLRCVAEINAYINRRMDSSKYLETVVTCVM